MYFFVAPYSPLALIADLIEILIWAIIIDCVIANIIAFGGKISPYHPFVRGVRAVVNPVLAPIRKIMPPLSRTGGWDFAPWVAIILLQVLRNFLF